MINLQQRQGRLRYLVMLSVKRGKNSLTLNPRLFLLAGM